MLKLKDHFIAGLCLAATAMLSGNAVAAEDPTAFLSGTDCQNESWQA